MRLFGRAESLQRYHRVAGRGDRGEHARTYRGAVEMYCAGPALAKATPETRPVQAEIVAQRVQQRHGGILDREMHGSTVDVERNGLSCGCHCASTIVEAPSSEHAINVCLRLRGRAH